MNAERHKTDHRTPYPGPGKTPALGILGCFVLECFLLTQLAFGFDLYRDTPPSTIPVETGSRLKTEEERYDRERVIRRNHRQQLLQSREKVRREEQEREGQHSQEVEKGVAQGQQIQQAIAGQEKQQADQIYGRTTGLDSYTIDKDGGFWRSHLGLTVEGVNILAGTDPYGNDSRGHYFDFQYNDLLNVVGITQDVKDKAGRLTRNVVSGITYLVEYFRGIAPKERRNLEGRRDIVTTTFHPTGESVARTEVRNLQYNGDTEGAKVIAQEITAYDLSGPTNPVHQKVSNMAYDAHDNLTSSRTVATDLVTGVTTTSEVNNQFSGKQLVSGTTKSITKDTISNTISEQTLLQTVTYQGGRVQTVEVTGNVKAQSMDGQGNPVDDFVTTTKSVQTMSVFENIPQPVKIVTKSHTVDIINVQEIASEQEQVLGRDSLGNLLTASATEASRVTNSDSSVVQETTSQLGFEVHADQPYLTRQGTRTTTHDGINEAESVTTSNLRIQLGLRHEVLGAEQIGQTQTHNGDRSFVSASEFRRLFDRSPKVNAIGLIRQETKSRVENTIEETVTVEERIYR